MERRNIRNAKPNTRDYYIGDNLARKINNPSDERRRRERREQLKRIQAQRAAERKERAIRNVIAGICGVIVIVFCVALLGAISKNNELTSQINKIENQINEITVLNDSKEYDIEASVDLDYVIQVATQELGMVRSSASQIITYETQNSEYVQQVAEIPTE